MRKNEVFFLAPPMVCKRNFGFAVIQLGADYSETLMLRLRDWTPADYMRFWHSELQEVADGRRDVGLLPTGVYRKAKKSLGFIERWEFCCIDGVFIFRDRQVVMDGDGCYDSYGLPKEDWWRIVQNDFLDSRRHHRESTWCVDAVAVRDWCWKYACVFEQMATCDRDREYHW